jgi:hypothetical protein
MSRLALHRALFTAGAALETALELAGSARPWGRYGTGMHRSGRTTS